MLDIHAPRRILRWSCVRCRLRFILLMSCFRDDFGGNCREGEWLKEMEVEMEMEMGGK